MSASYPRKFRRPIRVAPCSRAFFHDGFALATCAVRDLGCRRELAAIPLRTRAVSLQCKEKPAWVVPAFRPCQTRKCRRRPVPADCRPGHGLRRYRRRRRPRRRRYDQQRPGSPVPQRRRRQEPLDPPGTHRQRQDVQLRCPWSRSTAGAANTCRRQLFRPRATSLPSNTH